MKLALVNPPWTSDGSGDSGCREPHLPIELGYAKTLLERARHEVVLVDAHLGFVWAGKDEGGGDEAAPRDDDAIRDVLSAFRPDATVIATAPAPLAWRAAPPPSSCVSSELRVPMQTVAKVRDVAGRIVVVGPHASTTPHAALRKLGADLAILGECEDVLVRLASKRFTQWPSVPSTAHLDGERLSLCGGKAATDVTGLPSIAWPRRALARHRHRHHRFEGAFAGPGAEVEWARGCPYHCTACAMDDFRDELRKRPLDHVLEEIDGLVSRGVRYVYFVDEIFVPERRLLEALAGRDVRFGCQLRLESWTNEMLELLARAGCVSIATYEPKPLVDEWREKVRPPIWANDPPLSFPFPGAASELRTVASHG